MKSVSNRFVGVTFFLLVAPTLFLAEGQANPVFRFLAKNSKLIGAAIAGAAGSQALALEMERKEKGPSYTITLRVDKDFKGFGDADFWWGKPDIFPVLQIEGIQNWHLVPHIMYDYAGGEAIFVFKPGEIPSGHKVSVFFYDDDGTSNDMWNNLLSTPVSVDGSAGVQGTAPTTWNVIQVNASGTIQLVDGEKKIVIDAAEQMLDASFVIPQNAGRAFELKEERSDGRGNCARITLSRSW